MPAAPSPVRYFSYWVAYGKQSNHPTDYTNLIVRVTNDNLYISALPPDGEGYTGSPDPTAAQAFADFLATQDMKGWDGLRDSKAPVPSASDRDTSCRWSLSVVYDAGAPANLSLDGMDDGTTPKRRAFEQALLAFLTAQRTAHRASQTRHIETLEYRVETNNDYTEYQLTNSADEDGKTRLAKHRNGKILVNACVHPDILSRLAALIRDYKLDTWHRFNGVVQHADTTQHFALAVTFDTTQAITACGEPQRNDGVPPQYREVDAALTALFEHALGLDTHAPAPAAAPLTRLRFKEYGTAMGSGVSYDVYSRLNADGAPEMVLRFGPGIARSPHDYREVVLDTAALTALVTLCKTHNIAAWNGFHKNTPGVPDGRGFFFALTLPDGTNISAAGENAFPSGYSAVKKDIKIFLRSI